MEWRAEERGAQHRSQCSSVSELYGARGGRLRAKEAKKKKRAGFFKDLSSGFGKGDGGNRRWEGTECCDFSAG